MTAFNLKYFDTKPMRPSAAALALLALTLGGCSISLSDLGGSDQPSRTKDASGFPAVNDLPGERQDTAMEPAQRAKIEGELIAARDRQAAAAAAEAAATSAAQASATR